MSSDHQQPGLHVSVTPVLGDGDDPHWPASSPTWKVPVLQETLCQGNKTGDDGGKHPVSPLTSTWGHSGTRICTVTCMYHTHEKKCQKTLKNKSFGVVSSCWPNVFQFLVSCLQQVFSVLMRKVEPLDACGFFGTLHEILYFFGIVEF